MPPGKFGFRAELSGHGSDVRCLCAWSQGAFISGSRDGTVRLWTPPFNDASTKLAETQVYVSSLSPVPPNETYTQGLLLFGDQRGQIRAVEPESKSEVFKLTGHSSNVVALAYDEKRGMIVSGSWDSTGRIWAASAEPIAILEGHGGAVWDVAVLPDAPDSSQTLPTVLTASADHTICLWLGGRKEKTFQGHTDCVRALAVVDAQQFLSAANDATIRLWSVSDAVSLRAFGGHTAYIYSLALLPDKASFVSSGEDGSVRVWSLDSEVEEEKLLLPAQSVWSVAALENGDVAAGASDGQIRIFTRSEARGAAPEAIEAYHASVAAFTTTVEQADEIGGIKVADLPGPEILEVPGKRDGAQVIIRRKDGGMECHAWNAVEGKWSKLGDVVGEKKPEGNKKMYLGREYDFVFDVDIQDGAPKIKLPYNMSEDPWTVAQAWIHKNNLPQTYLDTVANFIVTNAGPGAGAGAVGGGGDPLTGNRYMPSSSANNSQGGGSTEGGFDPFTGAGRYVPSSNGQGGGGGGADPLTGGGRYIPGSASDAYVAASNRSKDPLRPVSAEMPLNAYISFQSVSAKPLLDRLLQLNSSEEVQDKAKLLPEDIQLIGALLEQRSLSDEALGKVLEGALQWPFSCLVPVLDSFRLALLRPQINAHFMGVETLGPSTLPQLLDHLGTASSSEPPDHRIQMLVARCVANALTLQPARDLLASNSGLANDTLVRALASVLSSPKASAQVAAASALANAAFALHSRRDGSLTTERQTFVKTLTQVLSESVEIGTLGPDVLLLLLQSLVTALYGDSGAVNVGKGAGLEPLVARFKDVYPEENGKTIARAMEIMLHSELTID